MKCQSWVDPQKFNKKGKPRPRSVIGTYRMDWDRYLSEAKGSRREKLEAVRARAVRCGGRLHVYLGADCDELGTQGVEVDVRCENCMDYVHSVGLNEEVVEQWIQERLDATE